jgi:cysteinyl-tRNA synthetase
VVGNGGLTLRRNGSSVRHEAGTVLPLSLHGPSGKPVAAASLKIPEDAPPATSLRAEADGLEQRFTTALAAHDLDACVAATLDLEQSITDWTADTNASDDADHARGLLRGMILRLGDLAVHGLADPADTVRPFVDALLAMRADARTRKDFAASDRIRDTLADAGIDVRDTPDGPQWTVAS